MKVAFLIGAGASKPAGMPQTDEITRQVLSGEGCRSEDRITNFLTLIRDHCTEYFGEYGKVRTPNYEDLYYAVAQIADHVTQEYENPALEPFIRELSRNGRLPSGVVGDAASLGSLAVDCREHIHEVVTSMLHRDPERIDHLECVIGAVRDSGISRVNVFTLNHDLVLERALLEARIESVDGFGISRNGVRYWNPALYDRSACRCRVFKLHGSINWYEFRPSRNSPERGTAGIPSGTDPDHTVDRHGRPQNPLNEGKSLLLIGTFNKMLHYTGGIFADLYCGFRRHLFASTLCVVSGYGFRDKGINGNLVEWLRRSDGNTLVIVHGKPEEARNDARGAVRDFWDVLSRKAGSA